MTDLSTEEISDLRQSLEFDRNRVGMAGCNIRKRAAWLLELMDLADNFAVMERGEVVLAGTRDDMVEEDVRRYLTV